MYQFIVSSSANKSKAAKLLLYQAKNTQWSLIKLRPISTSSSHFQSDSSSTSSSNPKPKSGKGFKLVFLALTGFTIGIGYATLNSDARRQIESVVPQSQLLFEYIDQYVDKDKFKFDLPKLPSLPEFNKSEKPQPVFEPVAPKKAPEIIEKKPSNSADATLNKSSQIQPQVQRQPEPSKQTKPKVTESKPEKTTEKPKDLDWKNTLKQFDLQEEASINALENKLHQLDVSVKLKVSEALNSSYVAIESLNKYRQALRNALDETKNIATDKELEWRQVTDLFDLQQSDVNEANEKFLIAKNHVDELDKLIQQVKSNEFNKNVKNLKETQTDLVNQLRQLQIEQTKLQEAIVHANVLKNYTHEQKIARNQFLKEMQALQPEGITKSSSGDQLSNDEINSLLIHAHKRVLQLQKQIEKIQLTQNQQIQAALEEQRSQNLKFIKDHDLSLKDLHRKEFDLELEKILENEKSKAHEELKKELSRQAAAHNNHLAQMLRIQQDELNSLYEKRLLVENERTKKSFYDMVSESLGRLKGIEQALNARANLELQASNAKQLWLAVQNLTEIIQTKAEDLNNSPISELVSIKSSIEKIHESAPNNEFIQKILNTVSEPALSNGVWSEPDLKDRFTKLKKVCNQVALIDDRGGSLFKYIISYLQSFVIIHPKIDKSKLDEQTGALKLDGSDSLNTFKILDYAEYYVENGNLEYALRLLNQLNGEPKRLAKDWIKDASLLLEIKQACNLLNAYISSIYIGTNLK